MAEHTETKETSATFETPSLDHVRGIVERRRRNRYRVASGTVGVALAAGLGYASLRGDPISTTLDEIGTAGPGVGLAPPSSGFGQQEPLTNPAVDSDGQAYLGLGACPSVGDDVSNDPSFWLYDYTDEVLGNDELRSEWSQLEIDWKIPAIDAKALVGLFTADPTVDLPGGPEGRLLFEEQYAANGLSIEMARALAASWQMDPVSIKAMTLIEVPEVLEALESCEAVAQDREG